MDPWYTLLWSGIIGGSVISSWRRSGEPLCAFLETRFLRGFARLWHRCQDGRANGPDQGAAIVIANHVSHADPAFLQAYCTRMLHFLQARECYDLFLLRRIFRWSGCIPVRRGRPDLAAMRDAIASLGAGKIVCVFPEGDVVSAESTKVRPLRPGVALLALRSRAPVYPAYIAGGPRGGGTLGDWLTPFSGAKVVFGEPVDLSAYYGHALTRERLHEVARVLMRAVDDLDPEAGRLRGAVAARVCTPSPMSAA